jgi:transcription elongation factor Elf1
LPHSEKGDFVVTTLIGDGNEIRAPIQITRHTLPRVLCALFACPSCNWPLVGAKFSSCTDDDFHDEVFELGCSKCEWREAMLGRDALDRMVVKWSGRKVTRLIRGA